MTMPADTARQNPAAATLAASQDGATAIDNPNERVVVLDTPIQRGAQVIESVLLRKPRAGALRGTTLVALTQIDVAALQLVLPRIAEPMLTAAEIANLDPADLLALGMALGSFFLTKTERGDYRIA